MITVDLVVLAFAAGVFVGHVLAFQMERRITNEKGRD